MNNGLEPWSDRQADAEPQPIERLEAQGQEFAAGDPLGVPVMVAQETDQRRGRRQAQTSQQSSERPVTVQNRHPFEARVPAMNQGTRDAARAVPNRTTGERLP